MKNMNHSRQERCLMVSAVEQKFLQVTVMLQVTSFFILRPLSVYYGLMFSGSMCWIDWVMSTVPMSKYDVDFEETPEDTLGLRQSGNDYQVTILETTHSF